MTYRIHYTARDSEGNEFVDSIVITESSIEKIQERALVEVKLRAGYDCWSEEVR